MSLAANFSSLTPLSMRRIIRAWWPLAASWLLMSVELPALSAVVARLENPNINLAAYGGFVFPLSLIIESPIIMLLAASTALSRDWASYLKLRRFMMTSGLVLTLLHILIAFTPLYYVVVRDVMGAPPEVIEPARIGLCIMTPWTWSIAYRRFHQGVLIRFDQSRAVGLGTVVRLAANFIVLGIGYSLGNVPGIIVATSAIASGVVSEAIYIGLRVLPVLNNQLRNAPVVQPALTFNHFISFYVPLVLTSLLTLLAQPLGSAALSRMPLPLYSLAAWPVVSGLIFLLRSLGIAYNEVVVALLDQPGSAAALRRFATWLACLLTLGLLIVAVTPLSELWFGQISALSPDLVELARRAIWLAVPLPALAVMQSWYQGSILHSRRTRSITESVAIYLISMGVLLWTGVIWNDIQLDRETIPGLYIGVGAMSISIVLQTIWLWWRSRPVIRGFAARDAAVVNASIQAVDVLVQ